MSATHEPISDARLIFDAGSRSGRVWFVAVAVLAFALVMLWLASDLAQTYGLSPADGGVLAPAATRYGLALLLTVLGLLPLYGMWLYAQCYVTRLALEPARSNDGKHGALILHTLAAQAKRQRIGPRDLLAVEHLGTQRVEGVRAPYLALRTRGRRLPFVVDLQGRVLDEAALRSLLNRSEVDWDEED